jgi:hypothetical protein
MKYQEFGHLTDRTKGFVDGNFEWNVYTLIRPNHAGTVSKNATMGPLPGINLRPCDSGAALYSRENPLSVNQTTFETNFKTKGFRSIFSFYSDIDSQSIKLPAI